jgi:hypothetical protein
MRSMSRTARILTLVFPLALAACGRPTLPCNTPVPLSGADSVEFRYGTTRAGAIAAAVAGVPSAAVVSAKGAFQCPRACPFQTANGVKFTITGTSSSYSLIGSAANAFLTSNYVGYANYIWTATGSCAGQAPPPVIGAPSGAAACPGAAIVITAQANARSDVGIRVDGTVLCATVAAPRVGVQITYPDNVTRLVNTDAAGNFVDVRRDFDRGGTVSIAVVGNDNATASLTATILGP